MFDAHAESQRRVAQFVEVLERMAERRREMPSDHCFVILEDVDPNGRDGGGVAKARTAAPAVVGLLDAVDGSTLDQGLDPIDEAWRPDERRLRYVQFMFTEAWFFLDLPNQTLHRAEADQLLRKRSGFLFMEEHMRRKKPTVDDLVRRATAGKSLDRRVVFRPSVAPFLGFHWRQEDVDGMESMVLYWEWLGGREEAIGKVLTHNEDDCLAMVHVHRAIEDGRKAWATRR